MSNVLTKQIRERIEVQGENTLYMVRDFADLNNDGLVTRALSRLEKEGMLVRISQGIYPIRNRFDILKPSIDEIAVAIAQKDKARIIPSGLTALNKLGLSTLEIDANLRNDYEQMKYGFIYKDAPTYEHLIDHLKTLQQTFRQLDWK